MNNRELLEAAAKAYGLTGHRYADGVGMMAAYTPQDGFYGPWWSPLEDDGDALRLKVRLHLIVGSYASFSNVSGTYTPNGYEVPEETIVWHHETGGDPCAAERLAITRCAAAIPAATLMAR